MSSATTDLPPKDLAPDLLIAATLMSPEELENRSAIRFVPDVDDLGEVKYAFVVLDSGRYCVVQHRRKHVEFWISSRCPSKAAELNELLEFLVMSVEDLCWVDKEKLKHA
ncbi:MAG TPA: hypothetical protein VGP72_21290 [Planctomycetota bacterium]|jgi:hypothetical protein